MNSLEFLMELNNLDEDLIQSSLDFLREENKNKEVIKTRGVTLSKIVLIAAVFAGLIGVTAMATAYFPSLFRKVQHGEAGQYAILSGMEEILDKAVAANETFSPEVISLPQLNSSQIVIGETYFDDKHFLIAYRLDETAVPAQFGFGPNSENFEKLQKTTRYDEEGTDTFEGYIAKGWNPEGQIEEMKAILDEAGLGFIHHVSTFNSLFGELKRYLTDSEWNRVCEELKKNGHVGVVYREMHISDGIRLEDGEYLRPNSNGELWDICPTDEGNIIMCDVLDDILPDAFKGQDTLTLILNVSATNQYFYIDVENGAKKFGESVGSLPVSVTMTRSDK